MAMGVLYATGLVDGGGGVATNGKGWLKSAALPIRGEPIELVRVPTRDLFGVLVRRGRASVRRRLRGGAKPPG